MGRDLVDGAVGKARERHGTRVDRFALRAPFLGDRLRKPLGGQRQRRAGRRADRAAVQADFETGFARDDGGVLIKALHDCGGFLNSASSRRGTMTNWNRPTRSEEHTSELQSLMRSSYA